MQELVKELTDSEKQELIKELSGNDKKDSQCDIELFHDKGFKIRYNKQEKKFTLTTTDYDVDELQLSLKQIIEMAEKIANLV
jgi:hypothetical protein